MNALEAGDNRNFAGVQNRRIISLPSIDSDARRAMRVIGQDRDLPALPGAGLDADILQHDGEEPCGHLLARGHDGVIFPRVVQQRSLAAPGDEFVGLSGHGRDDDGDFVAGFDLAFDVPRDIADALDIGDGSAAEFHYQTGHGSCTDSKRGTLRITARPEPAAWGRVGPQRGYDGGPGRCQRRLERQGPNAGQRKEKWCGAGMQLRRRAKYPELHRAPSLGTDKSRSNDGRPGLDRSISAADTAFGRYRKEPAQT